MAAGLPGLGVYVINLDRSTGRMREMDARLRALGLEYARVPAVDGKAAEFTRRDVNPLKYALAHGKRITPSEVGCYISHYNAMREFLKSRAKHALILEDDMLFGKGFVELLREILARRDWDMVKLNGAHGGGNIPAARLKCGSRLVLNAFHQSKSGAYLINRRAAKSYVGKMLPMFVPLDHEFIKFWKYGLRGFSVAPFPTREDAAPSTIDYPQMKSNRLPAFARITAALYKSHIALRRIAHAAAALVKNKFTLAGK